MNESTAARYQRLRRRAQVAGAASGFVTLVAVAMTSIAGRLGLWAGGAVGGGATLANHAAALTVFVVVLVCLWEIAALPALLYLTLRVDRRRFREAPAVEEVLGAQAQATLVALPIALGGAALVQISAWIAGPQWWVLAGVTLSAGLALALRGAPAILARLGEVRAVTRASLLARLDAVAARAHVPIAGIEAWTADAGDSSALVTGLGRTRRVFVSATMLRDWSDDEIAVVVAHELAHHAHHDLWLTLAFDSVVLIGGLGIAQIGLAAWWPSAAAGGPAALEQLPAVAMLAGGVWIAATPLRHALSRRQERLADIFALAMTDGADAFTAAVRRLSEQHLAEERPSRVTRWFFHRHPSVAERLALADAFRAIGSSSARSLSPEGAHAGSPVPER